ncbi:MAG: S8 family serine peptidase [Verrucomicrobia bacterium]|nr:S8 family serine peptidase [Verrucomicrobiota bacterium]
MALLPSVEAFETVVVDGQTVAADRVLLRLRPSARPAATLGALRSQLGLPEGARIEPNGFERWRQRQLGAARPGPEAAVPTGGHLVVELAGKLEVAGALARLRAQPEVEYAEADGVARVGALPSDPEFFRQWHHPRIGTPTVWERTRGASNLVVAVVDTGLDAGHPDLVGRVLPGYNFVEQSENTADDAGHGTAVSVVLAANGDEGVGTAGMDWNCRLLPVRVLGTGIGRYSDMADGISYAAAQGARVINLSAGGDNENETLRRAIQQAVAGGAIFVTITHNDGRGVITFPGRMPECITVGSSTRDDRRATFSNWGPRVDLLAPGEEVWGDGPGGGTSISAPLVSGAAALLLSLRPNLGQEQVRALLRAGAADQRGEDTDTPGFDEFHGWGRLDIARSVALARSAEDAPAFPNRLANVSTRGRVGAGEAVLIGGLVVRGSAPKRFLLRALGPSLAEFGVTEPLSDPEIELFDAAGQRVASNQDWADSQGVEISASGFAPRAARDAALLVQLTAGAYTAVVRGAQGATGVALFEAYELNAAEEPRFVNLSTRGRVGAGQDVMIVGFVLHGLGPRRVLLRGLGPSLAGAGVQGALAATELELFQDGRARFQRTRWIDGHEAAAIQASGFAPTRPEESALLLELAPGAYTAVLRSPTGAGGVGLVEVYELP